MCIPPHHPMPSFSINSYYKQSTCIFKLTHQYKYFDWKKGNRVKSICIDFCCIIWLLILFAHVQLKRFVEYVRSYNMPQELFTKLIILFCSLLKNDSKSFNAYFASAWTSPFCSLLGEHPSLDLCCACRLGWVIKRDGCDSKNSGQGTEPSPSPCLVIPTSKFIRFYQTPPN